MNVERIAKTTLYTRLLTVQRVLDEAWTGKAAAQAAGVSGSLVSRWLRRYADEGVEGLFDRSSRPHRSPTALPLGMRELIYTERALGRCLSLIAQQFKLGRCTVWRWLKKAGLSRLPQAPREPVIRYVASEPGELLHVDIKKLRTFEHTGRLYIEQGGVRHRGAGHEYLHVAVDSCSRYAFVQILERENGAASITFLEAAIAHFAALGVTVRRFLTDNGPGYRGKAMAKAVIRLGVTHSFTRVRRPQTNGKAERFIRTIMTEWGKPIWHSSELRRAALAPWLEYYNHRRHHSALGFKPPVSRLAM